MGVHSTIAWTERTWNPLLGDRLPQGWGACYATARHSEIGGGARERRLEEERAVVREILRQHGSREEQVRVWTSGTGRSKRAFCRRLAEIDNG